MAKTYKISKGKEHIFVTIDDSGAYIIKDSAGRKVFLSKYQAQLMKFGLESLISSAFTDVNAEDVEVQQIEESK